MKMLEERRRASAEEEIHRLVAGNKKLREEHNSLVDKYVSL